MRVLWFTNTPSNYKASSKGYNGGGWISSLESEITKCRQIELAVAFMLPGQPFKVQKERITYYPIQRSKNNIYNKIKNVLLGSNPNQQKNIEKLIQIISDYKPDIIEIFGSEQFFGLVAPHIKTPVVLHIQGIINPYYNAYLPPFFSWNRHSFNLKELVGWYRNKRNWINNCIQEREILRNVYFYIGRTTWDERVTKVFNPLCHYFYGSEILREPFYIPSKRTLPADIKIVTTISSPLYKGFDLILKTAKILKEILHLNFVWEVFGNIDPSFVERQVGIISDNVNVKLCGVAQAEEIKNRILNCTCFFHPSYIDNSPNSVCEAQMLGCSVISTNVGGIPSLITDNETGFLIPSNDPYQAAYLIKNLYMNPILNHEVGRNAQILAFKRHDKQYIVDSLIKVYQQIIDSNQ